MTGGFSHYTGMMNKDAAESMIGISLPDNFKMGPEDVKRLFNLSIPNYHGPSRRQQMSPDQLDSVDDILSTEMAEKWPSRN